MNFGALAHSAAAKFPSRRWIRGDSRAWRICHREWRQGLRGGRQQLARRLDQSASESPGGCRRERTASVPRSLTLGLGALKRHELRWIRPIGGGPERGVTAPGRSAPSALGVIRRHDSCTSAGERMRRAQRSACAKIASGSVPRCVSMCAQPRGNRVSRHKTAVFSLKGCVGPVTRPVPI